MALAQTQALLARLFTDAALRREFFDAPADVARRFGMDEGEALRFATIDRSEVEAFARSLYGKRMLDLRKLMPLTAQALGSKFDHLLIDAIDASSANHRGDACALAARVAELFGKGEAPSWSVDIARYELAFIEASRPGLRVRRFRHDIAPIVSALRAGAPVVPASRVMIGVWARAVGGRLHWRLLSPPAFTRVGKPR